MIPAGDETHIMRVLGYMPAHKVLRWAQVTISPDITEKDIARLARRLPRPVERTDKEGDYRFHQHSRTIEIRDNGDLAKRIDAHIAARSKECGVHPDFYRRSLGWR